MTTGAADVGSIGSIANAFIGLGPRGSWGSQAGSASSVGEPADRSARWSDCGLLLPTDASCPRFREEEWPAVVRNGCPFKRRNPKKQKPR